MGSRGRSSSSFRSGSLSRSGGFRSSSSFRSGSSSRSGGFRSGSSFGSRSSYSSGVSGGLGFLIGLMMGKNNSYSSSTSSEEDTTSIPQYKKVINKKRTIITSVILGLITLIFIVLSACAVSLEYGKVMGTVTGEPYVRYEWGEKFYYTSYEYEVDGRTYYAESQVGWTMLPDPISIYVGGKYELYYQKSDPYVIYEIEDKSNLPTNRGIYLLFAFLFGVATVIVACVGLGKYEINPEWQKEQKRIEEQNQMMGKKRCEYCSNITEDSNAKCPQCGAPL